MTWQERFATLSLSEKLEFIRYRGILAGDGKKPEEVPAFTLERVEEKDQHHTKKWQIAAT